MTEYRAGDLVRIRVATGPGWYTGWWIDANGTVGTVVEASARVVNGAPYPGRPGKRCWLVLLAYDGQVHRIYDDEMVKLEDD